MRLFTSSSNSTEARRGWSAMLLAGFIWLSGVLLYEGFLRDLGHLPSVSDSSQLWAQERVAQTGRMRWCSLALHEPYMALICKRCERLCRTQNL